MNTTLYRNRKDTSIYFFEPTEQYIVVEDKKVLEVCNKERADSLFTLFDEGDYVDVPSQNLTNMRITEIGRFMENDLYFDLEDHEATSYEYNQLIPAINPPMD